MKSLTEFIYEDILADDKKDAKIRAKLEFVIWEGPNKVVKQLSSYTSYQKIECKYEDSPDLYKGIKISFLLGYKDNVWQLWAGRPGVVNYTDEPYKNLEESDFYKAVNIAIDDCVELIKDIKSHPDNWSQYYITTSP